MLLPVLLGTCLCILMKMFVQVWHLYSVQHCTTVVENERLFRCYRKLCRNPFIYDPDNAGEETNVVRLFQV
jgi:hypothetical protein